MSERARFWPPSVVYCSRCLRVLKRATAYRLLHHAVACKRCALREARRIAREVAA